MNRWSNDRLMIYEVHAPLNTGSLVYILISVQDGK